MRLFSLQSFNSVLFIFNFFFLLKSHKNVQDYQRCLDRLYVIRLCYCFDVATPFLLSSDDQVYHLEQTLDNPLHSKPGGCVNKLSESCIAVFKVCIYRCPSVFPFAEDQTGWQFKCFGMIMASRNAPSVVKFNFFFPPISFLLNI